MRSMKHRWTNTLLYKCMKIILYTFTYFPTQTNGLVYCFYACLHEQKCYDTYQQYYSQKCITWVCLQCCGIRSHWCLFPVGPLCGDASHSTQRLRDTEPVSQPGKSVILSKVNFPHMKCLFTFESMHVFLLVLVSRICSGAIIKRFPLQTIDEEKLSFFIIIFFFKGASYSWGEKPWPLCLLAYRHIRLEQIFLGINQFSSLACLLASADMSL